MISLPKKYVFVKLNLQAYYKFCPFSGVPLNDVSWTTNNIEIDHTYTSHRGSKTQKQFLDQYGHFVNSLVNLRPLAKRIHSHGHVMIDDNIDINLIDNFRELTYTIDEMNILSGIMDDIKYYPLWMEQIYPVRILDQLVNEVFQKADIIKPFWFTPKKYIKGTNNG